MMKRIVTMAQQNEGLKEIEEYYSSEIRRISMLPAQVKTKKVISPQQSGVSYDTLVKKQDMDSVCGCDEKLYIETIRLVL